MADMLVVILLGIVEGLTEFLPVSSTGHLLLCMHWLGLQPVQGPLPIFWQMFLVVIQIGAIAAVVVYFRTRIVELLKRGRETPAGRPTPLMGVIVGTIPVLIIGYMIHKWVENNMEGLKPVALALGIGGLIMLVVELLRPAVKTERVEDMSWFQAVAIGCFQILAVAFPGTSRSAATIIGGMSIGCSRQTAAEFSFFLAIPAMSAACGYSFLKTVTEMIHAPGFSAHEFARQMVLLAIGTIVSFLVAWAVIAAFMGYIRRRSFIPFAIYRLIAAGVVFWSAVA
ncbi:MAG: undecaprenyl-diphosphate phosphatase [Tepidisphaerales bacterium]